MKPFVGPPTVPDAGCAYAADIDAQPCGRPPTLHLLVDSAGWGLVALDTCDGHASIGRASGRFIEEHPYGDPCRAGGCFG